MTGLGGTSPDALLATCVKYPAAVPKPAPPKITERGSVLFPDYANVVRTYSE